MLITFRKSKLIGLDYPVRIQYEAWSGRCKKPQEKNCGWISVCFQCCFLSTFTISLECNATQPLKHFLLIVYQPCLEGSMQNLSNPSSFILLFKYFISIYTVLYVILTASIKICRQFLTRNFKTFQHIIVKVLMFKKSNSLFLLD